MIIIVIRSVSFISYKVLSSLMYMGTNDIEG